MEFKRGINLISFNFLGTSAGTPGRLKNVSSVIFRSANSKYFSMVDCGEGTQHRILESKASLLKISHIYITHLHGDHCLGLPGLISSRSLSGCDEPLSLSGPKGLKKMVLDILEATSTTVRFPLIFKELDPGDAGTVTNVLPTEGEKDPGFKTEAIFLKHGVSCMAWKFTREFVRGALDVEKLQKAGLVPGPDYQKISQGKDVRLSDGTVLKAESFLLPTPDPISFIIAGDNSDINVLTKASHKINMLVHEATFLSEDREKITYDSGHSSLEEVCEFGSKNKIPALFLTHFSPRYHINEPPFLSRTFMSAFEKHRTGALHLAHDRMSFTLTQNGIKDCIEP